MPDAIFEVDQELLPMSVSKLEIGVLYCSKKMWLTNERTIYVNTLLVPIAISRTRFSIVIIWLLQTGEFVKDTWMHYEFGNDSDDWYNNYFCQAT